MIIICSFLCKILYVFLHQTYWVWFFNDIRVSTTLLWSPDRDLEVLADALYGPLKTTENNKTILDHMIILTFKKEI